MPTKVAQGFHGSGAIYKWSTLAADVNVKDNLVYIPHCVVYDEPTTKAELDALVAALSTAVAEIQTYYADLI
jgi:hypothetical protein